MMISRNDGFMLHERWSDGCVYSNILGNVVSSCLNVILVFFVEPQKVHIQCRNPHMQTRAQRENRVQRSAGEDGGRRRISNRETLALRAREGIRGQPCSPRQGFHHCSNQLFLQSDCCRDPVCPLAHTRVPHQLTRARLCSLYLPFILCSSVPTEEQM